MVASGATRTYLCAFGFTAALEPKGGIPQSSRQILAGATVGPGLLIGDLAQAAFNQTFATLCSFK